ncbi:MAG: hypothetical protein ABSE82_11015 [Nitrososphaerales archaeon]|jgi:hypothetical protein
MHSVSYGERVLKLASSGSIMRFHKNRKRAISRILISIIVIVFILVATIGTWSVSYFTSGPECGAISVEGQAMYIHIVEDSTNSSIAGARLSASTIVTCSPNSTPTTTFTQTDRLPSQTTSSNGTITFVSPPVALYSVVVHYSGSIYNTTVNVRPLVVTNVTISIPSGRTSISYSSIP